MASLKSKIKIASVLSILLLGLNSCYTNINKQLDREVHVTIVGLPPISISNTGNSNFSGAYTQEQLIEEFMEGLNSEFQGSKIVIDDVNPEFSINFSQFEILESTETETVNDTLSDNHGEVYELTTLDVTARGEVVRVSDGVKYSWFASKDKKEKVTSNRSAGQVITGGNKDKTEYREKTLDSDEASSLSFSCGRRSGVSIVKEIYKSIN